MAQLFISYARRDGETLAWRVEADLRREGHTPWLDRRGIHGGDTWSCAIEDAINACEALIAVLTTGSYESLICRGEQLRALRMGKRIVPLLAQAQADRPIYLEGAHYLDFTDDATYPVHLAELLDHLARKAGHDRGQLTPKARQMLEQDEGLGAPMAAPAAGPTDWAQLRQRADTQLGRFRDGLAGRGTAAGLYDPQLYVERGPEEAELRHFADGHAIALLLVGDPGVGKTNLLARWADERNAAGDAVLVYPGERVDALRLDGEIARDLGFEDGPALAGAWPRLDALAQGAGYRLWIVVDGLNDVRSGRDGARQLLMAIDALVSRLPGGAVKVVTSCTQATWHRMDRQDPLRLAWRRYHRGRNEADVLLLERFTPEQAEAAYARYAARFALAVAVCDLPPGFRARLCEPLLLRLLAETLQRQAAPDDSTDFETLVFRRYFDQRIRRRDEQALVDDLAAEMLAQRSAALPMQPLLRHATLGPALQDESPDSASTRLLDAGVLAEVRGDLFDDDRLRFTYTQIGAYAIVRTLLRRAPRPTAQTVRELVAVSDDLPLAWESAITLMTLCGDAESYRELASDADPELRELALESLVRQHASDPARTRELLGTLLDSASPEQQRTALRAAFNIGPGARELLMRGALSDSAEVRNAVRDTLYFIWNGVSLSGGETRSSVLYFIWRHAPDFTRALMQDLVARMSWLRPVETRRILGFVLDLTITIYVNHCDRADVVEHTAALFQEIALNRLHLDRLKLGVAFERVVFRAVASVFADRILHWMLLDGEADPKAFFEQADGQRAALAQTATLLDPQADLAAAVSTLATMFGSAIHVVRGAATLAVAVHACADAGRTEPTVRALFDRLDARGRTWLLAGFAVLLPGTPVGWVPLLEGLTQRLLEETPGSAGPPPLLPFFDGLYVPLGLAYGKGGGSMPLFEPVLAMRRQQSDRACRLIASLGVVGFYHPQPVLGLLRPVLPSLLSDATTRAATVEALATIRTLHFDAVDALLVQAGASDALRRDVTAGADPARVQQFMRLIGYYNNAVHYCVHYPRMRRGLGASALTLLAGAPSAQDFVAGYATQAISLARECNFDLREWTRPDAPDGQL